MPYADFLWDPNRSKSMARLFLGNLSIYDDFEGLFFDQVSRIHALFQTFRSKSLEFIPYFRPKRLKTIAFGDAHTSIAYKLKWELRNLLVRMAQTKCKQSTAKFQAKEGTD